MKLQNFLSCIIVKFPLDNRGMITMRYHFNIEESVGIRRMLLGDALEGTFEEEWLHSGVDRDNNFRLIT